VADDKAKVQAIKDSRKKTKDDTPPNKADRKDQKSEASASTLNPKKFVIINPPLSGDKMNESRSLQKIDYLIRLGLGNQDHLSYYRQAMSDPKKAVVNPNLRKYVAEILDDVLNIIFNDSQTYNRLRTLLQKDHKIEDALMQKSERSGLDVEILREVYARGMIEHEDQEKAFARVNSFVAGGLARKMDADLMGMGTDTVTKKYADMTPGQSFELIKKALKGTRND